jgi:hypothetical protein
MCIIPDDLGKEKKRGIEHVQKERISTFYKQNAYSRNTFTSIQIKRYFILTVYT